MGTFFPSEIKMINFTPDEICTSRYLFSSRSWFDTLFETPKIYCISLKPDYEHNFLDFLQKFNFYAIEI